MVVVLLVELVALVAMSRAAAVGELEQPHLHPHARAGEVRDRARDQLRAMNDTGLPLAEKATRLLDRLAPERDFAFFFFGEDVAEFDDLALLLGEAATALFFGEPSSSGSTCSPLPTAAPATE